MSEHKTGSTFDKNAYWSERKLASKERSMLRRARTTAAKPIDMTVANEKTGDQKYVPHFGANRIGKRCRVVNRAATKKGNTHVVKIDEKTKRPVRVFTKIGSKLHQSALTNSKRIRKGQARSE